jgi:hypothetical protein
MLLTCVYLYRKILVKYKKLVVKYMHKKQSIVKHKDHKECKDNIDISMTLFRRARYLLPMQSCFKLDLTFYPIYELR